MAETLLAELPEDRATGAIAEIYDEIRRFSGVPYVSSLQRYLATMPGVLEWAWDAVRPAMVSGIIPETGWRLANDLSLPRRCLMFRKQNEPPGTSTRQPSPRSARSRRISFASRRST